MYPESPLPHVSVACGSFCICVFLISILNLLRGGMIEHWYHQYLHLIPTTCVHDHASRLGDVTLSDVTYVLAMLGMGLATATVVLMLEAIAYLLYTCYKIWACVSAL